jgi:hypothetical protein
MVILTNRKTPLGRVVVVGQAPRSTSSCDMVILVNRKTPLAGWRWLDLWGQCQFWVRILVSRGFETVNTIFEENLGFGSEKFVLSKKDVT